MTQTPMLKTENRENLAFDNPSRDRIQKILGNVAHDKAFFFYTDIGKPTGDFAVSLTDLCIKINTIAPKCLAFHLKRGDFENWIKETIGDPELSQRINELKASKTVWKKETTLKNKLHTTVKDRVAELQDQWQHALKMTGATIL